MQVISRFNQHPLLQPGTIDTTTAASSADKSTSGSSSSSSDSSYSEAAVKALTDLQPVLAAAAAKPVSVQQFSDMTAQLLYKAVQASAGGPHYEAVLQLRLHCQSVCLELLPVCVSLVDSR
jgi:hypothetical protein